MLNASCRDNSENLPLIYLLQILFALHDASLLSGMQLAGLTTMSVEPIHTGRSKVDIFLELFEAPDGSVVGQIEYDSCLWKQSSIDVMAADLLVRRWLCPASYLSLPFTSVCAMLHWP